MRSRAEETALIEAMRAAVVAHGAKPRPFTPHETDSDAMLRYLRARNYNVSKALNQYLSTLEWHKEQSVDALGQGSGADALGGSVATMSKYVPHALYGRARNGGPIIFKHMGANCRIKAAVVDEGFTLDGIARYNIWLNEQYVAVLAPAREWSVIIDAAGWHIGLFDSYGFKFLKRTAETDEMHYPELLHRMIIVNAPRMLAAAWRVIRTWLDATTREKIHILSERDPEGTRAKLLELAEPHQLPAQYGGTAPPLADWPTRSGIPPASEKPRMGKGVEHETPETAAVRDLSEVPTREDAARARSAATRVQSVVRGQQARKGLANPKLGPTTFPVSSPSATQHLGADEAVGRHSDSRPPEQHLKRKSVYSGLAVILGLVVLAAGMAVYIPSMAV